MGFEGQNEEMNESGIYKKITSGLIWTYLERLLAQSVTTVVTIILARMLLPEHYGVVSIVTIFISICDTLVVGGFSDTLIQKSDADELDFSTLFWFVLLFSFVLYGILFIVAPWIAKVFHTDGACVVLRVMGLRIPINSIRSIQSAYISKSMKYRYFFFATLAGTILSAVIGVVLAYWGLGVWALVAQYLANSFVDTFILGATCGWRPQKKFSFARLKVLYASGWKMQMSTMLATFYSEIQSFCIGKKYSTADLAFYDKGKQFPQLIMHNVQTSVSKVMLPAFSLLQEDREKMLALARKSVRTSSFVMFPLLIGLMLCADEFVCAVLTDKWMTSVPYLRIMSIYYMCEPIMSLNKQIVIASGDSRKYLIMEIEKKSIGIALIVAALLLFNSPIAIAGAILITQLVSLWIQSEPVGKLIGYSIGRQFKDVAAPLLQSLIMILPIVMIKRMDVSVWIKLTLEISINMALYIIISVITRNREFIALKKMIFSALCR